MAKFPTIHFLDKKEASLKQEVNSVDSLNPKKQTNKKDPEKWVLKQNKTPNFPFSNMEV